MKHITPGRLDELESLLGRLRKLPLAEKSRGVFHHKGRAFLHFHEDPAGLFADIRDAGGRDFQRVNVSTSEGWVNLLTLAKERLRPAQAPRQGV